MQPEFQNQHLVPQVYQRQFGYIENREWFVSVYKPGTKMTENLPIKGFASETNIFDFSLHNIETKRLYENFNGRLENNYNRLLKNIKNQRRITLKDNYYLNDLIANLICRTKTTREYLKLILSQIEIQNEFINYVNTYSKNNSTLQNLLNLPNEKDRINIASAFYMNFLAEFFKYFKRTILMSPINGGWITTDNPVCIINSGKVGGLLTKNSEIYFPLSKELCVYMYFQELQSDINPLINLEPLKIHTINLDTNEEINKKLAINLSEYLIMCGKIPPQFID